MGAGQAQERAWLQYSMAAAQSAVAGTAPIRTILNFATDRSSFANGLFDKATDARFRALVACVVRVTYGLNIIGSANSVGAEARVLKNGVALTYGNSGGAPRASTAEPGSMKRTLLVPMAANDYLELDIGVLENGDTITAAAEGSLFLMEFVRRT